MFIPYAWFLILPDAYFILCSLNFDDTIREMKRHASSHLQKDEKPRSSRTEDVALRSRTEDEKVRRRREWRLQRELEEKHNKLREKMILEYEIRRAREKGLPTPKGRCNRSRSRSKSSEGRHRRAPIASTSKVPVLSEKLEPSSGTEPLFKGPEGTQISADELRKIKVDIHRNIPGKSAANGLQRDIVNPEDVVVKRRAGEGSKPIFEREEIRRVVSNTEEIEEHRTVVTVASENLENKSKTHKRHSVSLSPTRTHSPRRTSSRHSRYEDHKHDDRESYRSDRDTGRSRDRSRERKESYKEKERRRTQSCTVEEAHLRERKSRRDYSRSRERDERKWDRDSHHSKSTRDERSYREYRGRSRERSRDRREADRSRERRIPQQHYFEQIPVPIYYGNFPPRPIMVGPLVPIRGQVALGGSRHPSMMGHLRPFPPRFVPPDMYRLRPPPNPRFGPMF